MKLLFLISLFVGCVLNSANPIEQRSSSGAIAQYEFVDSTLYNPYKKIRIIIRGGEKPDSHYIEIKVMVKKMGNYSVLQEIGPLTSPLINVVPEFQDLNGDGLLDMRLFFCTGGRGANEFFYCFVQDKKSARLRYIKNSENIPNLRWDFKAKSLIGTFYYGGVSHTRHLIQKDSLVEKWREDVTTNEDWTVRSCYKFFSGKGLVLVRKDSIHDFGESLYY